jgi:hypothetical protein
MVQPDWRSTRDQLMGRAAGSVGERYYTARDVALLREAVETIRLDPTPARGHGSEPETTIQSSWQSSEGELAATGTDGKTEQTQHLAPVAQWIEQRFPKPLVVRSTRAGGATPIR